jgi:hypothetical protein
MEEFEESGLLDEHDKVICVTYFDWIIISEQLYLKLSSTVSLHEWLVFVREGENTEVMEHNASLVP